MADSEEKLCRLVGEFGSVCERRKLRVNVGKTKVMRCSRYGNGDRMHVILNGEPLEQGFLTRGGIPPLGGNGRAPWGEWKAGKSNIKYVKY